MNYTKMKFGLKKGIVGVCILGAILLFTTPLSAQTNGKSGKGLYELFSTKLPDGAQWVKDNKYVRKGGYSKKTENYIYVGAAKSPAEMTGLSIPIRENPGPVNIVILLCLGEWGRTDWNEISCFRKVSQSKRKEI